MARGERFGVWGLGFWVLGFVFGVRGPGGGGGFDYSTVRCGKKDTMADGEGERTADALSS